MKTYSVSMINQYIKNMFLSDYALNHIYIKGEISNCKYHTSGHIYFTLKDEKSQMACVMFAGQREGLSFRLAEGQSVVVAGSVGVYERDGKYQLYAEEIRLDGAGVLFEKFEKLKVMLSEEGLFASEYKKQIPPYVRTLGIVTASTGAAIQDIITISRRRNPFILLVLCPAAVQGEGAAASIIRGIRTLDRYGVDVIIAGRGGGSMEDLWAFNEEAVVRAFFECNTPIISAVGHETDVTLSDFAADLRAPTPSAGAELAVCDIREMFSALQEQGQRMSRNINQRIDNLRNRTETIRLKLSHASPQNQILQKRHFIADREDHLQRLAAKALDRKKYELALLAERMKGLSPLERLSRGYAFAAGGDGRMINSVGQVKTGDRISISVLDGEIKACVEDTIKITRSGS